MEHNQKSLSVYKDLWEGGIFLVFTTDPEKNKNKGSTIEFTWLSLALFEGIVDVYEGKVVPLRMLKLPVALHCLVGHTDRWLQEAAWCCNRMSMVGIVSTKQQNQIQQENTRLQPF